MRARIVAIDAAAEYRDGHAIAFECTSMRPAVDARGRGPRRRPHPRQRAHARACGRRVRRSRCTRGRRRSPPPGEKAARRSNTSEKEPRRRIVDRAQPGRKLRARARNPAQAVTSEVGAVGAFIERIAERPKASDRASRSTAWMSRSAANAARASSFMPRRPRAESGTTGASATCSVCHFAGSGKRGDRP